MYPSTTPLVLHENPTTNNITINPIINFPSHHPYIQYETEEALFLQQLHDLLQQAELPFSTKTNLVDSTSNEKMAADDEKCTKNIIGEDQEPAKRGRSSKKDRHSKINTARGPRDRRMRLSVDVARRFFGLHDLLGFDKPSETLEWLLTKSVSSIKQLQSTFTTTTTSTNTTSSSKCGGNTSDHYYCEVLSGIDEPPPSTIIRSTSRKEKRKKMNTTTTRGFRCKISSALIKRELREKARERARERTKEKILQRIGDGEFKLLTSACGQGIMDMDVDVSKLGFLETVGEDQEDISGDSNLLIRGDNWPDPFFYQLQPSSASAQSSNLS